jgi:hypothetical protein
MKKLILTAAIAAGIFGAGASPAAAGGTNNTNCALTPVAGGFWVWTDATDKCITAAWRACLGGSVSQWTDVESGTVVVSCTK